jgi:hypothetical protein
MILELSLLFEANIPLHFGKFLQSVANICRRLSSHFFAAAGFPVRQSGSSADQHGRKARKVCWLV